MVGTNTLSGRRACIDLISAVSTVPENDVKAVMAAMEQQGLGCFMFRVVDRAGSEIGIFHTRASIPGVIEDDFGDDHRIFPEHVEEVFVPFSFEPVREKDE